MAGCGLAPGAIGPTAPTPYEAAGAGGPYTLFTQPDGSGATAIQGAISRAKKSIDLTMYTLDDPTVVTWLAGAANKGVAVRVLLEQDPFYTDHSVKHRFATGCQASLPTQVLPGLVDGDAVRYASNQEAAKDLLAKSTKAHTKPQVYWTHDDRFALTHEKSLVIDGNEALIMSNNLTNSGLGANREYGVVDTVASEVKEVEAIFAADIANTVYKPSQPNLVVSPDDGSGEGNARTKLEALIKSAKQSVLIEDEEFNDAQVAKLLGSMPSKVKVQVLLDKSAKQKSDPVLLPNHLKPVYWTMPNNGTLHAKLVLVDGKAAYIGSVNLSCQSMEVNRELGILLHDAGVVGQLGQAFASDWSAANSGH
jgi:phosphatidylserine/phosphatidylglycerophosphate/cardiolipin synthase-like enzyme